MVKIQVSGSAETWAANRFRTTVADVKQRVDLEGGLHSFVVGKIKNTQQYVADRVQRCVNHTSNHTNGSVVIMDIMGEIGTKMASSGCNCKKYITC